MPAELAVSRTQDRPSLRPRAAAARVAGIHVPPALAPLASALDASRWMLSLEDDWDGEGSPAYSEETWQRAAHFLVLSAQRLWDGHRRTAPAPAVHNGPEGTIDIQWVTPTRTLLINIPTDPGESAPFYGHDDNGHEINGTLDAAGPASWLLAWLVE